MSLLQAPQPSAVRRLGPLPWFHDGFKGLTVRAEASVPSADDPMIRGALVRGVIACRGIEALEEALNRQLRPLGYVARLEWNHTSRDVVHVDITAAA